MHADRHTFPPDDASFLAAFQAAVTVCCARLVSPLCNKKAITVDVWLILQGETPLDLAVLHDHECSEQRGLFLRQELLIVYVVLQSKQSYNLS